MSDWSGIGSNGHFKRVIVVRAVVLGKRRLYPLEELMLGAHHAQTDAQKPRHFIREEDVMDTHCPIIMPMCCDICGLPRFVVAKTWRLRWGRRVQRKESLGGVVTPWL